MPKTLTTVTLFNEKFIRNVPDNFRFQVTPSQIYPLRLISKYLVVPFPLIQADQNVLLFILSGSITNQIDTAIRTIEAPSVVFMPAGTIHSLQSISENLDGYVVLIENKVFSAIFNTETIMNLSMIYPVLTLQKEEANWISGLCAYLYEEASRTKPNRKIGQGLLQAMLYKILELSDSHKLLSRSEQIAIQFRELVSVHFKEQKTSTFYAEKLAISANYLNRCVQSTFCKSVKEMILDIAILHSQIMMWESSKGISEICYELGFEDPSHFARVFKKVTGQSPTTFKTQIVHDLS